MPEGQAFYVWALAIELLVIGIAAVFHYRLPAIVFLITASAHILAWLGSWSPAVEEMFKTWSI